MKNKKQSHKTAYFTLNALAASLFLMSHPVYALQTLDDSALRQVNGQDGIHVATTYDEINVKQFYWQDDVGHGSTDKTYTNNNLRAIADTFKISPNTSSGMKLGTDYKINGGSSVGGKTGLDLSLTTNPSLITIDKFMICDTEASQRCSNPIGNMAVQTSSQIGIDFQTRDGLFSKDSQSTLLLGLKNANIYLGQTAKMSAGDQLNQLILKNFNFNFLGKGVMFVDPVEGFKVQTNAVGQSATLEYLPNGDIDWTSSNTKKPDAQHGYINFERVKDEGSVSTTNINGITAGSYKGYTDKSGVTDTNATTSSGLNLEFMVNNNVNTTTPYVLDGNTKSPVGAKGLIRVGASGRMVNASLQLRGMTSYANNGSALANPIYGTNNYGDPNGTNILGKANNGTVTTGSDNIIGKSGIAFRMGADFVVDKDPMLDDNGDNSISVAEQKNATTLEIGGAGLNTYGFEFGNLSGLQSGTRGRFDSGNVYINLADTKSVLLPANYIFQNSRFGNGVFLTADSDYIQNIHTATGNQNPYSMLMAIRGAEFQAISRRGRFTNSATDGTMTVPQINEHTNNSWGLALPFYNLNANMAMFGTKVDADKVYYYNVGDTKGTKVANSGQTDRLGFSLAMSTDGIDKDFSRNLNDYDPAYGSDPLTRKQYKDTIGYNKGTKTTSIMVIDGGDRGDGKPTDYYVGLRNIDMLLKGAGSIGVENGSFNVSLKDMLFVMAADVAAGYLPGAKYKTCVTTPGAAACTNGTGSSSPLDNFARKNDALFGLKLRVGGNMDFSLIPNSEYQAASASNGNREGSRMNIVGEFELTGDKNTIQISDPNDGSTLGLDNIVGKMAFDNAIVIAPDRRGTSATNPTYGEGVVSFNAGFTLNPAGTTNPSGVTNAEKIAGVFRVKDINLYPPQTGNGARLGELAITGGRLNSQFSIIPRN
ncbi:DUF6160 family protein [Acinetobacter parvus]|uniref:DUF6160 family protein n=1 Tax=Acinetobacter parvus TaxID=134533 RepID=UPI00391D85BF